jgi:hypothetical protein
MPVETVSPSINAVGRPSKKYGKYSGGGKQFDTAYKKFSARLPIKPSISQS